VSAGFQTQVLHTGRHSLAGYYVAAHYSIELLPLLPYLGSHEEHGGYQLCLAAVDEALLECYYDQQNLQVIFQYTDQTCFDTHPYQ